MNTLQLVKHHGLGNDFLIAFHVDCRRRPSLRWRVACATGAGASAPTGC